MNDGFGKLEAISRSARVARCRQKKLMMGGRKITVWLDKEAADALRALEAVHAPLSMTRIVAHIIKEARSQTGP